jgi:AcrR family transcriptional regulator
METIPGRLDRLPMDGNRLQAEMLSRDPRERILIAMATIVARRGYPNTTVGHVVKRASVSRTTFYDYFDNREACLVATVDAAASEIRRRVNAASAAEADWPAQVRAGLEAFLDYVAENPALARTAMVESVTAGPAAVEHYERLMRTFSPGLALGRNRDGATDGLPETLEDSIVGGIVWMVHQRLMRNEIEEIPALLPTMLEFSLAPYLGENRAKEFAADA